MKTVRSYDRWLRRMIAKYQTEGAKPNYRPITEIDLGKRGYSKEDAEGINGMVYRYVHTEQTNFWMAENVEDVHTSGYVLRWQNKESQKVWTMGQLKLMEKMYKAVQELSVKTVSQ